MKIIEKIKKNILEICATLLSIAGATANAVILWEGFVLWIISNTIWIWIWSKPKNRSWGLVATFTVYNIISVYGLINWVRR